MRTEVESSSSSSSTDGFQSIAMASIRKDYRLLCSMLNSVERKACISIEGNIGSGKSTLLNIIGRHFDSFLETQQEPTHLWMDYKGMNPLEMFYENPKDNAHSFQIFAASTRSDLNNHQMTKKIRICERSLDSDFLFASVYKKNGSFSPLDIIAYDSVFRALKNSQKNPIHGRIYLRCDPLTSLERIKMRSRDGESKLELDYIQCIHDLHDGWLLSSSSNDNDNEDESVPVLVVNWDDQSISNEMDLRRALLTIFSFIVRVSNGQCTGRILEEYHRSDPAPVVDGFQSFVADDPTGFTTTTMNHPSVFIPSINLSDYHCC